MNTLAITSLKQIRLRESITEQEVVGKYAYNTKEGHGGIILEANERGFSLGDGSYHFTRTGNSVFDSFLICGYCVYEINP